MNNENLNFLKERVEKRLKKFLERRELFFSEEDKKEILEEIKLIENWEKKGSKKRERKEYFQTYNQKRKEWINSHNTEQILQNRFNKINEFFAGKTKKGDEKKGIEFIIPTSKFLEYAESFSKQKNCKHSKKRNHVNGCINFGVKIPLRARVNLISRSLCTSLFNATVQKQPDYLEKRFTFANKIKGLFFYFENKTTVENFIQLFLANEREFFFYFFFKPRKINDFLNIFWYLAETYQTRYSIKEVILLARSGKVPLKGIKWGADDYECRLSILEAYLKGKCNSVRTDFHIAYDVDVKDREAIKRLESLYKKGYVSDVIRTKNNNFHYLIPVKEGVEIHTTKLLLLKDGKEKIIGDIKGYRSYVKSALNKGYSLVKWNLKPNLISSLEELERISASENLFHLREYNERKSDSLSQSNPNFSKENKFISVQLASFSQNEEKPMNFVTNWTYQRTELLLSHILILSIKLIRHLGWETKFSGKCSRRVNYYVVEYFDEKTGKIGKFVIDEGYRPKDFLKLEKAKKEKSFLNLFVRVGQARNFFQRIQI